MVRVRVFREVRDNAGDQVLRLKRTAQMSRNEITVTFTPMVSPLFRVLDYALAVELRNNNKWWGLSPHRILDRPAVHVGSTCAVSHFE
jgi:hypothetical protein